ncbi:DUF6270 domain-containing protein [Vibrio kyushuensis]|uniref:DUF6270 domain-containing protein n=1 Tax=Vibrio kyushuensis TaxID=2910249 RepID=UPI003D14E377
MKVFIYGGCVSRDIFNYMDESKYEISGYYARSSYASSFCTEKVIDKWSENISSNFQRRMVESDLGKLLEFNIVNSEFDIILLDFNMERHPLFMFDDGSRCTLSTELRSGGFNHKDNNGRIIQPFTDEMYELWEEGWVKFIDLVDSIGVRNKIVVNKLQWTYEIDDNLSNLNDLSHDETKSAKGFISEVCSSVSGFISSKSNEKVTNFDALGGREFSDKFTFEYIRETNLYLNKIYKRISYDLKEEQFLSVSDNNNIASRLHRWGLSPFHYVDRYYNELSQKLLILSERMSSNVQSRKLYFPINNSESVFNTLEPISQSELLGSNNNEFRVSNKKYGFTYHYYSIDDFKFKFNGGSGLHSIYVNDNPLEILISNGESQECNQDAVLFFTSAITKRTSINEPYFNGYNYAKSSDSLCVMIADPVMRKSEEIATGWYNNLLDFDVISTIEIVIEVISNYYRTEFIAVGGSAGGFAALNFGARCKQINKCFVFGPQTDLLQYHKKSVSRYFKVAFSMDIDIDDCNNKSLFERWNVEPNLSEIYGSTSVKPKVVYLVNDSDYVHLNNHAVPFISGAYSKIDNTVRKTITPELLYIKCSWGKGHIPPNKELIYSVLDSIITTGGIIESEKIIDDVGALNSLTNRSENIFDEFKKNLICNVEVNDNTMTCSVSLPKEQSCKDVVFAFYLLVDGVAKCKRMYSKKSIVNFELDCFDIENDPISVKFYIKTGSLVVTIEHNFVDKKVVLN